MTAESPSVDAHGDPVRVRRATAEDAPRIVEFNRRLAAESEGRSLEPHRVERGVRAQLQDPPRGRYYVAERGGTVVGQLAVTTEWSDWRDGFFWWIQSVFVEPSERRQGIFRSLFQKVEEEARGAQDCCGLRLYVERENEDALRSYRAVGLKEAPYRMMELELPEAPSAPPSVCSDASGLGEAPKTPAPGSAPEDGSGSGR